MIALLATHTDRGPSRWVAALTALLFVQGIASTFLHFDVESHYFCVEHQQLTHDADHAREARQDRQTSVAENTTDRHDRPSDGDDRRQSDDCLWMTWLQTSSHASPDLAPQLLNLPPPAAGLSTVPPRDHQSLRRPVSIDHVSPINSPPSA